MMQHRFWKIAALTTFVFLIWKWQLICPMTSTWLAVRTNLNSRWILPMTVRRQYKDIKNLRHTAPETEFLWNFDDVLLVCRHFLSRTCQNLKIVFNFLFLKNAAITILEFLGKLFHFFMVIRLKIAFENGQWLEMPFYQDSSFQKFLQLSILRKNTKNSGKSRIFKQLEQCAKILAWAKFIV